jgi:exopolysaccharide biosynthesis protein
VDAANYLRTHPVGGPLYNSFDWGGFLSFYMPEYPVAIDGRTDLYGDAMDSQFLASEGAEASYATDPYLNEAGVVILKNKVPLAKLLPTDSRFRVIYRDDVATVLARN